MNCPKCGRVFRRANQRHACGTGMRSEVLRGRAERLGALYSSLETFAESLGPTDLTVMTDALRVVVHLNRRVKHPLFFKTAFDRKRFSHVAKIQNEKELAILKPYVKEAYELSLSESAV